MFTNSISTFANSSNIMSEALREANEPYYVTLQKSFRGDRVAMREIAEQEDKSLLQQQLWQLDVGQTLDVFA